MGSVLVKIKKWTFIGRTLFRRMHAENVCRKDVRYKLDQIPYSEWSHVHFDRWKMISDYPVLIPLSASPNSVSDLGDKSVKPIEAWTTPRSVQLIDTSIIQIHYILHESCVSYILRLKDPSDPHNIIRWIFPANLSVSKNPSWTLIYPVSILIPPQLTNPVFSFYFCPGRSSTTRESQSLLRWRILFIFQPRTLSSCAH